MKSGHWNPGRGVLACLILLSTGLDAQASPWFEAGDAYARFQLQRAVDRNQLDTTVTTWPLARSNAQTIKHRRSGSRTVLQNEMAGPLGGSISLDGSASSERRFIRGFDGGVRDAGEVGVTADFVGDNLAFAISPSYTPDPADGEESRLDGSYLAATGLNWTVGAGAIDRWWGPGWQSSMILSSNARPVPSVWLNRRTARTSDNILLKWLGPWQFTGFVGRLESNRYVPDAKLIGMRLNFRPVTGLEIGFSRLIQWGGEGRPETGDSLRNALLGRDNVGSDGIEVDPGNQLAGIDLRYGFSFGDKTLGLYTQVVGEDEAGAWPSRKVYQLGADFTTGMFGAQQQWFFEAVDTTTDNAFGGEPRINTAYEHSNYRSGMRYLGWNLATTFESDARAVTLGLYSFSGPAGQWNAALTYARLNRDGTSRFSKGEAGSSVDYFVPQGNQNVAVLDLSHTRPLPVGQGRFRLSLASDQIELADQSLGSVSAGFEWRISL